MDPKNYNVYGIVFGTACEMPTEQRNNPWLLCHAIADAVIAYIENMPSVPHAPVQPRDIFDTEHTDDLPVDTIGKSRLEQYVELYNMGFKPSRIAAEMGISLQGTYSYKNLARKKGLIK